MEENINSNTKINEKQDLSIKAFRLLVVVIWTQYTILSFAVQIIRRLPIVGFLYEYAIPIAIIVLALFSLPYMLRKVRPSDILFYICCLIVVLGNIVLNEETAAFIEQDLWRILGLALPMLFIGVAYSHEDSKNDLFWASIIGVIVMYAYQFYSLSLGRELEADNMDAAYKLLPSVMYLTYWAMEHKKLKFWIISGVAMLMMFLFGTRGPIIAMATFLFFGLFFGVFNHKSQISKLLYLVIFGCVIAFLCSGTAMVDAAKFLSDKFESMGFSTRVFDHFIEGEITKSNGRNLLYDNIIHAIEEKPILGYGLMGDRTIVGFYVHNLFLEVLCQFGVVIGSMILLAMIGLPIIALIKTIKTDKFNFVLMLICTVFVKLMVTGSYVTEANLFLLLGISLSIIRSQKIKS